MNVCAIETKFVLSLFDYVLNNEARALSDFSQFKHYNGFDYAGNCYEDSSYSGGYECCGTYRALESIGYF